MRLILYADCWDSPACAALKSSNKKHSYVNTPSLYTSLSAPGEWFVGDGQAGCTAPAKLTCRKLSWQQRNSFFFMMDSALRSSSFLLRAGSLRQGKTASSIERKQCDLEAGRGQYSVKDFIRDKTTSPEWAFSNLWCFCLSKRVVDSTFNTKVKTA